MTHPTVHESEAILQAEGKEPSEISESAASSAWKTEAMRAHPTIEKDSHYGYLRCWEEEARAATCYPKRERERDGEIVEFSWKQLHFKDF